MVKYFGVFLLHLILHVFNLDNNVGSESVLPVNLITPLLQNDGNSSWAPLKHDNKCIICSNFCYIVSDWINWQIAYHILSSSN